MQTTAQQAFALGFIAMQLLLGHIICCCYSHAVHTIQHTAPKWDVPAPVRIGLLCTYRRRPSKLSAHLVESLSAHWQLSNAPLESDSAHSQLVALTAVQTDRWLSLYKSGSAFHVSITLRRSRWHSGTRPDKLCWEKTWRYVVYAYAVWIQNTVIVCAEESRTPSERQIVWKGAGCDSMLQCLVYAAYVLSMISPLVKLRTPNMPHDDKLHMIAISLLLNSFPSRSHFLLFSGRPDGQVKFLMGCSIFSTSWRTLSSSCCVSDCTMPSASFAAWTLLCTCTPTNNPLWLEKTILNPGACFTLNITVHLQVVVLPHASKPDKPHPTKRFDAPVNFGVDQTRTTASSTIA